MPVEIIVEIGNDEQKDLIAKELEIIHTFTEKYPPKLPITCIVPTDFDKKINEILGINNYKSTRKNEEAQAKYLKTSDKYYLIFSQNLYTSSHDNHTRWSFYIHEFFHIVNYERFPTISAERLARNCYLKYLYILFDEYSVIRSSMGIIESSLSNKSPKYTKMNRMQMAGMLRIILNTEHYSHIYSEISSYRSHGNINRLLDALAPTFDSVSKAITYIYAFMDQCPSYRRFEPFLSKSKFIHADSINLMNFFKAHLNENNYDLSAGISLMQKFMEHFGINFEDRTEGLYCQVKSI